MYVRMWKGNPGWWVDVLGQSLLERPSDVPRLRDALWQRVCRAPNAAFWVAIDGKTLIVSDHVREPAPGVAVVATGLTPQQVYYQIEPYLIMLEGM